ncbi:MULTISPECIES: NACHT domain-containing protein [Planktothrix]|jgi:Skp family chaperone for outer membrane proteins|uniref:NTPase (NACHT family)-like protein n=1 Tax=Planktothrix rubescens CCAP 1459/22 TaxID=329571 RepID=A0A6J7ZS30_PLARU|nr:MULTISPECIES: NACHT domain-containing protein [Planktothrix]CAC5345502.1 NTPase (NACHT family)-like protein [Planktothrix rubescens NIVA-CYA 18]CAD5957961.1 NTPase (NACHT family)-like protein [Planktothrix rubescens NIVA-CYA 18]CAH2573486.1 NTPase (NACHT family)-like protein [Planktothrix rubescens]
MDVTRSLIKLIIGGGCMVGGLAFPPLLAADGIVWGTILATALASVAAGNTANAIDALIDRKDGDRISLQNQDLTKAVGKAIAAVITLAALQNQGKTHDNLEKIASQATNNWVKIAQQELTQQRYPQLREAKLDQFLTPEEYSLTQEGNLTPQEWQDIFIRLNMAACKGGGFQLPPEVYPQVAELLHTTFPKALRETLKEDFANDGKAFAGLTLQLLTGMKAELTQLRNTNLGVNTAELTQILQQFQQLETQLRGTVAQQQAFFRQISQDIDSGFAEVCQQLGVMETNITALLQNLEKRLEALDEKLARLEAQGGGRQLSKQEYRHRQALLSQMGTEVESRLAQSLHHAVLLNLGKEQQPHQVQRPWDVSVKVGEQRTFQLPSETSILEVFENPAINGKFLILGKPGGGKTTTLLELAQALVERAETDSDAPIPVILELSEWRTVTKREFPDFWNQEKYDPSIKEWILSQLWSKGVSQEIGEQWIREKELVLLLDGLDELPSERQAKCVQAINQFLDSEFSPLHLVVGSRKEEYEEYEEVLHLNGAIYLEDLSVEQIQHYFTSVNLGEFWESIKDSEKIVNFISQPLFLAITSIAYQQIDVEEWRNCNTEQRAIDYLLGIYRILAINGGASSTLDSSKRDIENRLIHRRLVWVSKYLEACKQPEIIITKLQPIVLFEGTDLYRMIDNFIATLLSLFWFYIVNKPLKIYISSISYESNFIVDIFLFLALKLPIFFMITGFCLVPFFILIQKGTESEEIQLNEFSLFRFSNTYIFFKTMIVFILKGLAFFTFLLLGIVIWRSFSVIFQSLSFIQLLNESISQGVFYLYIIIIYTPLFLTLSVSQNNSNTERNRKTESKYVTQLFLITTNTLSLTIFWFLYYTVVVKSAMAINIFSGAFPWDVPVVISILIGIVFGGGYGLFRHFLLRFVLYKYDYMPWNINSFLNYCTKQMILQRVGNRYRFIHRLVQEHFANLEIQKE